MVKKTLFTTFIILLIYSLAIHFLSKKLDTDQTQWSDNIIKAQNYLYNPKTTEYVILGTSLSNRIITDSLGENFTNLAFSGLSLWDGANLVLFKPEKPKMVFIESNLIFNSESKEFAESAYSYMEQKKKIPILQEKNQPVGVLKGLVYNLKGGKTTDYKQDSIDTKQNDEVIKINVQAYSKEIEEQKIQNSINKLNDLIIKFNQLGIKVLMYETPVISEIQNSKKMTQTRNSYPYIKNVTFIPYDTQDYKCNDGIHLNAYYALKYTKYLKNQIKNIVPD